MLSHFKPERVHLSQGRSKDTVTFWVLIQMKTVTHTKNVFSREI